VLPTGRVSCAPATQPRLAEGDPVTVTDGVDLYWIPLGAGAGGALVRWSGRTYEAVAATLARRHRCQLFHSALEVRAGGVKTVVEMAPVWTKHGDRGVVCEAAVGARFLGRWRAFRYEVRRWRGGSIPDLALAVGGPTRVTEDPTEARRVLELVPEFPACTWGRDELSTGEMWNSNSLPAWLLARAGLLGSRRIKPPPGGRAPGWDAGLIVASRAG
jgi:hypothetical protein